MQEAASEFFANCSQPVVYHSYTVGQHVQGKTLEDDAFVSFLCDTIHDPVRFTSIRSP